VTIDVHGSLDRAKDVSSNAEALFRRHYEECVRLAHADDVPLLILPEDTCCRRCDRLHGNEPRTGEPDRPRPAFLRQPAKAIGFPRIRVPSTVARAGTGEDCSSSFPAPASRSRRPHVAPMAGDNVLLRALQASVSGRARH